ncbi:MAG: antibiotic biosynthesis monooxygenase [Xanthobacteraceae bacterium]
MRSFFKLAVWLAIVAAVLGNPARAQDSAVYVVTYIELMPNEIASGTALLKRYRDVSRRQLGNLRFDVLHEIARSNRFAILETWKDKTAQQAHDQAAVSAQIRDRLKAIEDAPADERIDNPLYMTPGKSSAPAAAVYVITHVDIIPPGKADGLAALKAMSIDTPKDPGNIAYQVLVQANRSNHFTILEAWSSKAALDAHAMTEHARSFRQKLTPFAGAIYDDRFYKAVN